MVEPEGCASSLLRPSERIHRGEDVADEDLVADAIDWCIAEGADLLSLSLGGETMRRNLATITTSAVDRALDSGMFVIAAAGNDGGSEDDGEVSSPASMPDVIAVGAVASNGSVWEGSSVGAPRYAGVLRTYPDQKPEVVAPAWPSSPRRRMECSDRASARPYQPCSLRLGSPTSSRLTRGSRRRATTHGVASMWSKWHWPLRRTPMCPELSMIEHGGTGPWMFRDGSMRFKERMRAHLTPPSCDTNAPD